MQLRFTPKHKNESYALHVGGKLHTLGAGDTIEVPDEEWAKLCERPTIKARLEARTLRRKGPYTPAADDAGDAELEDVDVFKAWPTWHWRKCQRFLDGCTDKDTIKLLLGMDNSAAVEKRLTLRLEELEAGEGESAE